MHLKKDWKIAQKLSALRKKKPDAQCIEIHDIVGLTIVVNFPSDRTDVAEYLKRADMLNAFKVIEDEVKEEHGYHAIHLKVQGATLKNGMYFGEIQIKTMLHDGWGAKTHDLTYKPEGKIEEALKNHMRILGDVLRQLDDQSELIKDAIKDRWNVDRKRRELARHNLFRVVLKSTGASYDGELIALAKDIDAQRNSLSIANVEDAKMKEIHSRVESIIKQAGYGRDTCRLLTFLASTRADNDLYPRTVQAIDNWIGAAASRDKDEQLAARIFRPIAQYALGEFREAVASAREALKFCEENSLSEGALRAKANLAYFLSELAFGLVERDDKLIAEAMKLSEEALAEATPEYKTQVMDTRGSVLIACGGTESDVREGLKLCQEAFAKAAKDEPVAEAFFRLHERRAFRRILEWD
jgi:ppGpp synthetase/RelA/SpoT-type nucleotidyltranferase